MPSSSPVVSTPSSPTPGPADPSSEIDPYDAWKAQPTPANLSKVVHKHRDTVKSAINAYVPQQLAQSPTIQRRAEIMAAEAVHSFDPSKGAKLSSHIYGQLQPLRRVAPTIADPMPKPERLAIEAHHLEKARTELADTLGRPPSLSELSSYTKIAPKKLVKLQRRNRATVAEGQFDPQGESEEDDFMPGVKRQSPEAIWAEYVYHDLGDVDKVIFEHRTGYGGAEKLPNQEIARRLRISAPSVTERANKIQARLDQIYGQRRT